MKLTLDLSTDERLALRRFANEHGVGLDVAARLALRGYKADQLLILGRTAKLIEARSSMDELRRLVA